MTKYLASDEHVELLLRRLPRREPPLILRQKILEGAVLRLPWWRHLLQPRFAFAAFLFFLLLDGVVMQQQTTTLAPSAAASVPVTAQASLPRDADMMAFLSDVYGPQQRWRLALATP